MQKAEFQLNLSRSSSGRARSRGLRSPHSKRLGSLEPTVCSLGWFYADTDLRPGPPSLPPPPPRPASSGSRPGGVPAARRARGLAADVTGKVSNSGARPPETGFTLSSRVTERSASLLRRLSLPLFFPHVRAGDMHRTRSASGSRCAPLRSTLNAASQPLLIIFIENYGEASARARARGAVLMASGSGTSASAHMRPPSPLRCERRFERVHLLRR